MKNILFFLLFLPAVCSAQFCTLPWEDVPSPVVSQVKTCRLSVPHGWLVSNFTVDGEEVEIPQTFFYPDEHHEWVI